MIQNTKKKSVAARGGRETEVFGHKPIHHGRHSADIPRMPDPQSGVPVTVTRVRDGNVLDGWLVKGRIDRGLWNAGNDFRAHFYRAGLNGRYAAAGLEAGGRGDAEAFADMMMGDAMARRSMDRAFGVLGPAQSDIAWFVLGEEYTLRRYAERCRVRRMSMTPDRAAGILVATLETLALHYGHMERAEP